jgi:glucosylceramidase
MRVIVHTNDKEAGTVEYTAEYYTRGQFTKFVTNGALRIDSDDNPKVLNVAFQNPNGSLVLIAFNDTTETQRCKIVWHERGPLLFSAGKHNRHLRTAGR